MTKYCKYKQEQDSISSTTFVSYKIYKKVYICIIISIPHMQCKICSSWITFTTDFAKICHLTSMSPHMDG